MNKLIGILMFVYLLGDPGLSLLDGMAFEEKLFYLLFASADQKEGMAAFVEKRSPDFRHR